MRASTVFLIALIMRAEVHVAYEPPSQEAAEVTFSWTDANGEHVASHVFASEPGTPESWTLPTGEQTQTRWVEYRTKH